MLLRVLRYFLIEMFSACVKRLTQRQWITCLTCRQRFRACDSIGSYFDQCQDCWEGEADRIWWEHCVATQSYSELGGEA